MNKLSYLMTSFFMILILSFPFSSISPQLFSILLFFSILILIAGLYLFLSGLRTKKVGKIRLESVQYPFTYVIRAYTSPKNLWIVFDERVKKFRAADFSNVPIKVVLVMLFGLGLLYSSYLIWFTIFQVFLPVLFLFRVIVMFMFFVMGLYSLCVGLYRLFSLNNKKADKICSFLNRNKLLTNLIKKGMLYAQISPNFLLKEGFVDSIEFILVQKIEVEKLEKILIDAAKLMQKL